MPLAFDGGLGRLENDLWRADAFYMRPVEPDFDNFDDRPDPRRELWSLYATRDLPSIGQSAGLDLFYIGFHDDDAVYDQGEGAETRHTLGSRFFGSQDNWKWDFEGHLQFGGFADGDILAGAIGTSALFVLVRKVQPEKVLSELKRFKGNALRTSLSPEQEARLQAALDRNVAAR